MALRLSATEAVPATAAPRPLAIAAMEVAAGLATKPSVTAVPDPDPALLHRPRPPATGSS